MKKKIIYGTIFALMLCFIWGNSMLSREMSGAISHFIADILGGEQGATEEGHFLLRKAAHFTEYLALGIITWLFFGTFTGDRFKLSVSCGLVGVLAPLIDETIQMFSDRGSALADVWIDISGFFVGFVAAALVIYIFEKAKKRAEQ